MTRAETKGERERERQRQNRTPVMTSHLLERVTPQILSLSTKPFAIFTDA